jgi:4a-hydroxytetrahydrobiopterin dehydratase
MDLMDDDAIARALGTLEGWARDGDAITKEYDCSDFVGSVRFVEQIVGPAEAMGHHPDLTINWNKVGVSITNHAAGGLTAADFELAGEIDKLRG